MPTYTAWNPGQAAGEDVAHVASAADLDEPVSECVSSAFFPFGTEATSGVDEPSVEAEGEHCDVESVVTGTAGLVPPTGCIEVVEVDAIVEVAAPVAAVPPTEGDECSVERGGEPTAELGAASVVDVEAFLAETLTASGPEGGIHMGVVVRELERLGFDIELVACFMASPRFSEVFYVEGESLFRVGADAPLAPPGRPSGAREGGRAP